MGARDPEPSYWDIDYNDTSIGTSDWDCSGAGPTTDWRPGVNEQPGSTGDVQDTYDNFAVYQPRVFGSAYVNDPVPVGVNYQSCLGCTTTNPVHWDIGSISNTSGSFTWWGAATCLSNPINNQAYINRFGQFPRIFKHSDT